MIYRERPIPEAADDAGILPSDQYNLTEEEFKEIFNQIDIKKTGKIDKAQLSQFINYLVESKDKIKCKSYYNSKLTSYQE